MDNINAVTDRSDLKISGQLTPNNAEVNGSLSENKGMSARLESVRRVSVPAVLSGLADVDISAPVDGQTLVYDAEKGVWKNGEGNVVANLGDLKDVDLKGLNDGEVIKYNSQTGKWVPATLTYADVGALPSTTKIPEVIDRLDTYSTKDALSAYQGNVLKNLIDSNWGIPVKKEMPEDPIEYINEIFQYIGETNEKYTHGYFYQCIAEDYTRYYAYKSYKNEIFYIRDETPTLGSTLYLARITGDPDTDVLKKEFYPATDDYPNVVIKEILYTGVLLISKTGSNVRNDTYDRSKTDDDYDGDIYWKQINVQPSENNLDLSIVGGALNQTYEEEENAQGAETTNPIVLDSTAKETVTLLQRIALALESKPKELTDALKEKIRTWLFSDLVTDSLAVATKGQSIADSKAVSELNNNLNTKLNGEVSISAENGSSLNYIKAKEISGVVFFQVDIQNSNLTKGTTVARINKYPYPIGALLPCIYRNTTNGNEKSGFITVGSAGGISPYETATSYNELRINTSFISGN